MATQKQVEFVARLHRQCEGIGATKHQKETWSRMTDVTINAVIEGYTEALKTGDRD